MKHYSKDNIFRLPLLKIIFLQLLLFSALANEVQCENSAEESLIKSGGSIFKQLGGALSDYGTKKGGLIGKSASISGEIYSDIGEALTEDDRKQENYNNQESKASYHNNSNSSYNSGHVVNNYSSEQDFHQSTQHTVLKITPSKKKRHFQKGSANSNNMLISSSNTQVQKIPLKNINDEELRNSAKTIHRSELLYDTALLDQVESILLDRHMHVDSRVAVDALSWLCKILGDSQQTRYLNTLSKVSQNGSTWKLRMYAIHNRDKLKEITKSSDTTVVEPDIEVKLEKLAYLKNKGLITNDDYRLKKQEILDLL